MCQSSNIFSVVCHLTKTCLLVLCLFWKDLLAVGYGEFDTSDQKQGLVCCWSLKNPVVWLYFNLYLLSQTFKHHPWLLRVSSAAGRILTENLVHVGVRSMTGVVMCPLQWPDQVIHCDSPVTSLDFSSNNPSQLAVGMLDGTIAIYYVQSQDNNSCVISSR